MCVQKRDIIPAFHEFCNQVLAWRAVFLVFFYDLKSFDFLKLFIYFFSLLVFVCLSFMSCFFFCFVRILFLYWMSPFIFCYNKGESKVFLSFSPPPHRFRHGE